MCVVKRVAGLTRSVFNSDVVHIWYSLYDCNRIAAACQHVRIPGNVRGTSHIPPFTRVGFDPPSPTSLFRNFHFYLFSVISRVYTYICSVDSAQRTVAMSKYKKILRVNRNVFEDPIAEIKRLRAALRAMSTGVCLCGCVRVTARSVG